MHRQSEKNLLNSSISSICRHNMVNFGLLTAKTDWWVWGTHANFKGVSRLGFVTAATSRSTEVNQTLHDVWPSAGLVYCIYIFRNSCFLTKFCQVQNTLCVQVLRSAVLAALLPGTRALGVNRQTLQHGTRNGIMELSLLIIFNRGRHLYSEGGHHGGHRPTF